MRSWIRTAAIFTGCLSWLTGTTRGQDLFATDGQTLFSIDAQSFAVTTVGPMALAAASTELWHGSLSFDFAGSLWSMSHQKLYQVDPATGQTSLVGAFKVSNVFEGGLAVHPTTGVAYCSNYGSASVAQLMRMDLATGQCTELGRFGVSTGSHDMNGLGFDGTGQLYGIDRVTNSLWRIDHTNPSGPATHQIGVGLGTAIDLGDSGGLTFHSPSNSLIGYAQNTHALFTVDVNTGVGTIVKQFNSNVPKLFALAARVCSSTLDYGSGCAGSGGFVPEIDLLPCPAKAGHPTQLTVADALGGAQALLLFGLGQGSASLGGGCALLVQPLLPPIVMFPLGGAGPGNGGAFLGAVLPGGLPTPFTFTMQAFVVDPGVPLMFSNSRGLQVTIEM